LWSEQQELHYLKRFTGTVTEIMSNSDEVHGVIDGVNYRFEASLL
jgi:hypothetical protein